MPLPHSPRLALGLLLCATALSGPAFAQSACSVSGSDVTCAGSGTGFTDDSADGVSIAVTPEAVVAGDGSQAFDLGPDVTLSNAGTVRSDADHAVQGGDGAIVINSGTIESTDNDGINVNADATVSNSGRITAAGDGIQTEGGATITNSGTVTAERKGIKADGDDVRIVNTGTVITGEDGLRANGANARIENAGRVTAFEDAIKADGDGGIVRNSGTIVAGRLDADGNVQVEGDGIQTENGGTVVTTGTITATKDGVNVGDDSRVTNSGTIEALDDGVQIGANSIFVNEAGGSVTSLDEAINANEVGITVINHGTITASDDGINAATGALIENYGTIISDGGEQDGVDLDSGTVRNAGTILAIGTQDGIDFDPGTEASTVTNTGRIEGAIGINTDPADTGAQTVVNAGTITGRDGTAINLGAGDDVLILNAGSIVNGAIEMGEGEDTLQVNRTGFGRLTFGSAIETVETAGPAIVRADGLVMLDDDALRVGDRDVQELAHGLSRRVLTAPSGTGFWAAGRGSDSDRNNGAFGTGLVGYDLAAGTGTLGGFIGLAESGDTSARLAGFRYGMDTGRVGAVATAFLGRTDGDDIAGSDGADGDMFGVAGRLNVLIHEAEPGRAGFDMAVEGGWSRTSLDGYDLTQLDTRIGDRDVNSGYVRGELGLPVALDAATTLRGRISATRMDGDADDIVASFGGTPLAMAGEGMDRTLFGIGASWDRQFANDAILSANAEASFGGDADGEVALGVAFRMPIGR